MITNRDLAVMPRATTRTAREAGPSTVEAWERFAAQLTERSLDRVQRVMLRLLSRASVADPDTRRALLGEADELDAAMHAAREVLFPPTGPHDHAPPAAVGAAAGSVATPRSVSSCADSGGRC